MWPLQKAEGPQLGFLVVLMGSVILCQVACCCVAGERGQQHGGEAREIWSSEQNVLFFGRRRRVQPNEALKGAGRSGGP